MFKNRTILVTLLTVVTAFAAAALATPGSGVTGVIQARAKFLVPVDIKIKIDDGHQEVIHVPDSKDTVIQQVVFEPQGFTGWHSHPGPAIALVKSGTLTLFDSDDPSCTGKTYTAGQAFIDYGQGHGHLAGNPSATERAELWITLVNEIQEVYRFAPNAHSPRVGNPASWASTSATSTSRPSRQMMRADGGGSRSGSRDRVRLRRRESGESTLKKSSNILR